MGQKGDITLDLPCGINVHLASWQIKSVIKITFISIIT